MKLKYRLILFCRLISRGLELFPMKKNRILFYSFAGKQYSDSPRYISDYIRKEAPNKFEIVWAINNVDTYKKVVDSDCKLVKYKSLRFLYYYVTSKFIITNLGPFRAVKRRNEQEIINTWHGGGAYKKDGVDNPYKTKYEQLYNALAMKDVTLFLSSSEAFKKYCILGAYKYNGKIADWGMPRNDVILDKNKHFDIKNKVKKYYGIDELSNVVLFAPTWRNYNCDKYEKLDIEHIKMILQKKTGEKWEILCRKHNLTQVMNRKESTFINATNYPDMQELLIASDILISDYSSCIWDFSLMKKPVYLFVPDIEKYESVFGFSTPINSWGFCVCRTNKEIYNTISNFESSEVIEKIERNHKFYGITESGMACKRVYDYIRESCDEK